MGKSGYLPDISSGFTFWRSYAVNCLKDKDYNGATSGLHNINALLTEDYIVSVDTEAYNKQTEENIFYECGFCKKETAVSNIQVCQILLSPTDSIISKQKTTNKWRCPECEKWVSQQRTNIIKDKLESPYYRRVVPECPTHSIGLGDRLNFSSKFDKWFYNFLEELQHALALYRIEYIAQNGEDMADLGFKENRNS
ncbi:hypothetical protein C6990_03340 [Nitrosopumilus sp. b3]|uniref:hypothetical protein n=1 Tax=Nitrosopumilus sp. b3 TaxID=2109909 RepID=UPI0015F5BA57|nr:hypothetical protein [Nitrosopumilus sp. b3]KAF6247502.1 hypothetical protein C6990_03340 [Nitrosopumilus sp. b3]